MNTNHEEMNTNQQDSNADSEPDKLPMASEFALVNGTEGFTSNGGSGRESYSKRLFLLNLGRESKGIDEMPEVSTALYSKSGLSSASGGSEIDPADVEAILLLGRGNDAYKKQNYEDAIELFSRALLINPSFSFLLLSNRCASFCSLSAKLRLIPAAQSEQRALYGLDPTALAQLALRDAEKLLKFTSEWPKAHLRRASALTLLEQYDAAMDAYLQGLELDPSNPLLQEGLRDLKREEEEAGEAEAEEVEEIRRVSGHENGSHGGSKRKRGRLGPCDEFDCSLCLKLLYNPVTTPCGHTFCRPCLVRALDHSNKCPVCRTVLFVSAKSYPVSVTLQTILEKHFPEEYAERKAETEAVSLNGREVLPLFVMDVVLPGQKMALNIFEPRYRLMVRRCMEGDHKMGMVGIDAVTRLPADVACEVEICECEPLPDGRFYLEVEGRRRCRIVRIWEQDGYRVGQVECFEDQPPSAALADEARQLAEAAADLAQAWVARVQEASRNRRGRLAEVVRQAGDMPHPSQPEKLSFWLANLLPFKAEERLAILRTTDTCERLKIETDYLRTDHSQSCRLQ